LRIHKHSPGSDGSTCPAEERLPPGSVDAYLQHHESRWRPRDGRCGIL